MMGVIDGKAGSVKYQTKGFICLFGLVCLFKVKLLLDLSHMVRGEDSQHALILPFPETRVAFNLLLERR